MRKPDYYQTPLRSRKDITDWIISNTKRRCGGLDYDGKNHMLCFNVKVNYVDFDFDHLLEIHRKHNDDPIYTHNDEWLAACRDKYTEVQENLWDRAIENARSCFLEMDAYRTLWDGTEVAVRYGFYGRSGGWLSITEFEGIPFAHGDMDDSDWRRIMEGKSNEIDYSMDYRTLRKLYGLVVILKHYVNNLRDELEYLAADILFELECDDIPRPDAVQPELAFAE